MKNRLREIRTDLHMTQAEFGTATGKGRDTITSYELGRVVPDESYILLLEIKYHYRAEWIRTGQGEKRLPEPEADEIARIAHSAAYLDADAIRVRVHQLVDGYPAAKLKLLASVLTQDVFPPVFPGEHPAGSTPGTDE